MSAKVILIVAVVAIAAVGGGAAAVILMNDHGSSSLEVDHIRNDLAVDDFYEFDFDMTIAGETTMPDIPESYLKGQIYQKAGDKDAQSQDITYKGAVIACDVYRFHNPYTETDYVFYVHPTSGVTYKTVTTKGDNSDYTQLSDSNIDLMLTEGSLTFKNGDYVKYTASATVERYGKMNATLEYRVMNYNDSEKKMDLYYSMNESAKGTFKEVVTEVDKANDKVVTDNGSTYTTTGFLSGISYDSLYKNMKDAAERTVTFEEPRKDVKDTVYGKRDVKIQYIVSKDTKSNDMTEQTVTYGDEGVIYSIDIRSQSGFIIVTGTITLKSSNMVYR